MQHNLTFDKKIVLVTGAARGIGRAIAIAFAREGADLILLDHPCNQESNLQSYGRATPNDFDSTIEAVRAQGRKVTAVHADVTDLEMLKTNIKSAVEDLGGLDVVVPSAGYIHWHGIEDASEEEWDKVIAVNLSGVWKTLVATIPYLKLRGSGRVVAIGSLNGRSGFLGSTAYTASKWGLIGLIKSAAIEFGQFGISANVICPGPVETQMFRSPAQMAVMNVGTVFEQDMLLSKLIPNHPKGPMNPRDIAEVVLFLAGPSGSIISGVALDVAMGLNAIYSS